MKKIENQQDFSQALSQEMAILSFFVDWSLYSKDGINFPKEAEKFFLERRENPLSFWLADASYVDRPASFVFDWLKRFDEIGSKIIIWAGTGNPSILWLKSSQIIDYEFSAYLLKTDGIIKRTVKFLK